MARFFLGLIDIQGRAARCTLHYDHTRAQHCPSPTHPLSLTSCRGRNVRHAMNYTNKQCFPRELNHDAASRHHPPLIAVCCLMRGRPTRNAISTDNPTSRLAPGKCQFLLQFRGSIGSARFESFDLLTPLSESPWYDDLSLSIRFPKFSH